jgi:Mg/Co/Ni transporter MgtE
VEVVFDIELVLEGGRLYLNNVDFSRHALFRRMHIYPLADLFYGPEEEKENEVSWLHVQQLSNISSFGGEIKLDVLKDKLLQLRPVEIADVLEQMEHKNRVTIMNDIETHKASDILEEIDPAVQRELIASLNKKKVVKLLEVMTPGQAADILSVLPAEDRKNILESLNKVDRDNAMKISSILGHHEENLVNYVTKNFIKVSPDEIVEDVQEKYHIIARKKDVTMYLYVVDKDDKFIGVLDIKELLRAPLDAQLKDIMIRGVMSLHMDSTLRDASVLFSRYEFRALPITDKNNKLVGVVPYKDVMKLKHIFWE